MSNPAQVQHDRITGSKAKQRPKQQTKLDEALNDSFPASDPPAQTVPVTTQKADTERLAEAAQEHAEGKARDNEAEAKQKNAEAEKKH
jgi:hypothetical protein